MFLINLLWWKQALQLKSNNYCPVYHGHLNISFLDSLCTVRLVWHPTSCLCLCLVQCVWSLPTLNALVGFLLSPTAVCPSWHLEPPSVLQLRLYKRPSGWWSRIISCVVHTTLPCRRSVQSLLFSHHHGVVDSSVNDYNHLWDLFPQTCCWDSRIPSSHLSSFSCICQKRSAIFKNCFPSLPKFPKL